MFPSYPFGSSYYPTRRERYLQALAEQEERQRYEQALRQRQQMLRQRQYEEALRQQEYQEALRQQEYQEALRQRHLQQALRQREQEEALERQRRARRSYGQEELDPFYSMLFGEPTRASRLSRSLSPKAEVRQPQPHPASGAASPAASPKHSPSPSPAPAPTPAPSPAPSAPSVDLDTPASLIQSTWRTHRSLAAVSRILSKFDALRASFSFPTTLDFDPSTHALLYTPTNAPLRAYEHALGKILEELDAVESWGVDKVRKERRRAVKVVESELGALDEKKKDLERATFMEKGEVVEAVAQEEMVVDEPTKDMEVESAPVTTQEPQDDEAPATLPTLQQPDADISMDVADVDALLSSSDIIDHPTASPDAAAIPLPSLGADEVPLPESDTEDSTSVEDDEDDELLMEMFESARSSPEMVHVALPELEDAHPTSVPETQLEHKIVEQMLDPAREVDGFELL